jgi:hypothetical protein
MIQSVPVVYFFKVSFLPSFLQSFIRGMADFLLFHNKVYHEFYKKRIYLYIYIYFLVSFCAFLSVLLSPTNYCRERKEYDFFSSLGSCYYSPHYCGKTNHAMEKYSTHALQHQHHLPSSQSLQQSVSGDIDNI